MLDNDKENEKNDLEDLNEENNLEDDAELLENEHKESQDNDDDNKDDTLENQILELQKRNEELQDQVMRGAAEIENIRTRSNRSVADARNFAVTNFANDLIAVIDNFDRLLAHIDKDNISEDMKHMIEAAQMTHSELMSVFNRNGITVIKPQAGDAFDYNLHHAISHIESKDHDSGVIVDVMQAGYKIKDRLLRPASVAVAK